MTLDDEINKIMGTTGSAVIDDGDGDLEIHLSIDSIVNKQLKQLIKLVNKEVGKISGYEIFSNYDIPESDIMVYLTIIFEF